MTKVRLALALVMVWVGGMGTVVTVIQLFPDLFTPPPPVCQEASGAVYEAAPYRVPEAPRTAPARPEGA